MSDISKENSSFILTNAQNYKIAQVLYHVITGKTEKSIKAYKSNYHINMTNIEQLYSKFKQMLTQWKVLGDSCNIIVNHCNDNKDEFSSYERFKLYDTSKASAIEDITFKFSFLLKQENLSDDCREHLQNYDVTIRILNKVAYINNNKNNRFRPRILRMISDNNLIAEIEYVDYTIARNIISTIDSWEQELDKDDNNIILNFFQNINYYIPILFRFLTFIITGIILYKSIPTSTLIINDVIKYLIMSSIFIFFFSQISFYLGRFITDQIDGMTSMSYININKGDEKEIKKYKKNNIFKISYSIFLFLFNISLTIFIERLIDLIRKIF